MINALDAAWATIEQHQEIRQRVLESLTITLENSMTLKRRDVDKLLETAYISLLLHVFTRNSFRTGLERLQGVTMQYMIKNLPRILKEKELCNLRHMKQIITILVNNIQTPNHQLDKLLAICLKLGITDVGDYQSCFCIKVAKHIVSVSSVIEETDNLNVFSPAQVHDMILTHSKFKYVMENDSSTRKELIDLMVCCVSLSKGLISIPENDKIDLLLLNYRGSVRNVDRLLRLLLHSYKCQQNIKVRLNRKPYQHCEFFDYSSLGVCSLLCTVSNGDRTRRRNFLWIISTCWALIIFSILSGLPNVWMSKECEKLYLIFHYMIHWNRHR